MEKMSNYAGYTWDQLQDALAHIKRDKYPDNFAALQTEIERRLNEPPPPIPAVPLAPIDSPHLGDPFASSPKASASVGLAPAFCGWLCGTMIGVIAAYISFVHTLAHMKAIGGTSYQRDGVGFGLIGLVVCYGFLGGLLGIGVVLLLDE